MKRHPKTEKPIPVSRSENLRLRTALGSMQRRIRELTEEKEATRREVAELRRAVAEQIEYLDELAARVQLVLGRDDDLRAMLLGAHEQLMRRADEIRTSLAAELHQAALQQNSPEQNALENVHTPVPWANYSFVPGKHSSYQDLDKHVYYSRLREQIRKAVQATLPPGATVVVVSKGDEELLELGEGRRGWHFPQNEEGVYAGYYPANSIEAIAHLEELRERGAEYLLFPGTALWWLEKYEEFSRHLDGSYRRVWDDETCVIFELAVLQPDGGLGM